MTGAPGWAPYFFDMADPDGPGEPPGVIVPILIDYLVRKASHTTDWRIDNPGGSIVTLSVIAKSDRHARIGFAGGGVDGVIDLSLDPAGWLCASASAGGAEVFRAYVEQIWEEYELWPPGADKVPESPGRIGKRRNWISLRADAWPALAPLANEGGWVNLVAMDYSIIHVRILGQGADIWRPMRAVPADLSFELLAPLEELRGGEWEFPPGAFVQCEMRKIGDEDAVVAVALAQSRA